MVNKINNYALLFKSNIGLEIWDKNWNGYTKNNK